MGCPEKGVLQCAEENCSIDALIGNIKNMMIKLKKKIKSGLKYVIFFNVFTKIISFLTTIVLARILVPKDFGMIALAFLAINAVSLLSNFGFAEAIIQSRKNIEKIRNSCFFLSIIFSIALMMISFLVARPVSDFYNKPELALLIVFLSFTFLIESLGLLPSAILEKEMAFSKKLIPETLPIVIYASLAVWLAIHGVGYWSIAIAHLVSRIVANALFWILRPWKPGLSLDLKSVRYVLSFGKEIFLVSIFLFALTQGDNALVGKVLGVEALGFYVLAYTITSLPATNFVHIINRVTLPAYAKIQKNRETLKRAYLKVFEYVSLLAFPMSIGLMMMSREITLTFYGEKWSPIILPIIILSIFGLFRAISSTSGSLFIAIGKPHLLRRITLVQLTVMAVTIYPLTAYYGIIGTSLAVTFAHLISIFLIFIETSRIIDAPIMGILNNVKISLFSSVLMALALAALKLLVFTKILLINTLILIFFGAAIYFAIIEVIKRGYIRQMVKEALYK